MPNRFFKKLLPTRESIKHYGWMRHFGSWLHHPLLWCHNRRAIAGGFAIGLFCGLVPGPFQILSAVPLVLLFRVNLPVALVTTLYTNPLTIAPLYLVAYKLGAWVTGNKNYISPEHFALPEMSWGSWHSAMLEWVGLLGKPLAVGLPLLAIVIAVVGYFAVRAAWYAIVVLKWRRRAAQRKSS